MTFMCLSLHPCSSLLTWSLAAYASILLHMLHESHWRVHEHELVAHQKKLTV